MVFWEVEGKDALAVRAGIYKGKVLLIGFLHFRWLMQGVILGSIALPLLLFGLLSGSGRSGRPVDKKGETERRDLARGTGRGGWRYRAVCM
jgi:hypothetical protein